MLTRNRLLTSSAIAALAALGGCSYTMTDTAAIEDLRQRQAALEQAVSSQGATLSEVTRKQAEIDGKIRVMWTHGK